MGRFLITGRSGIGKTTMHKRLLERGYNSFDGDKVPGLSRWEDVKTGEPLDVDPTGFVDYEKVAWNWNGEVLRQLLASHDTVFLCGSASNQIEFHPLFDQVFALVVDPVVHEERVLNRKGKDHGKHPETLKEILQEQPVFTQQILDLGAIPIDANNELDKIIGDIVSTIDEN